MKGEEPLAEVGFSLDGQRLLTSDAGGRTRLWDSNTGLPLSETLRLYSALGRIACCFDPTGERITAGGWGGIVRVWDVPPPPTPVPECGLARAAISKSFPPQSSQQSPNGFNTRTIRISTRAWPGGT
jgi:WD40 repeat protein